MSSLRLCQLSRRLYYFFKVLFEYYVIFAVVKNVCTSASARGCIGEKSWTRVQPSGKSTAKSERAGLATFGAVVAVVAVVVWWLWLCLKTIKERREKRQQEVDHYRWRPSFRSSTIKRNNRQPSLSLAFFQMAGPPLCLNTFMNIEHHNSCCYMSSFFPPPIQTKTSEKWTLCASKYITNDNRSSCSAGLCGRCSRSAGEPGESYWPEIIRAEKERDSFPTCGSWLLTRSPTIVRSKKGNIETQQQKLKE